MKLKCERNTYEGTAFERWLKELVRRGANLVKRDGKQRGWTFLQPEEEKLKLRTIPDNPCIPYMRTVVESLLKRRGCSYQEFYPVVLDFDEHEVPGLMGRAEDTMEERSGILDYECEREILRLRRQADSVLEQLAPGLNRMVIRTHRPVYFEEFVQTMYEENGLMVQIEEELQTPLPSGSFVLDFGLSGGLNQRFFREDIFYLPIYQRTWEIAANLDILVPIGYNTVIVKGAVTTSKLSAEDRFEQEFYRN